ncbi:DUF7507 domain-containing protein [Pedobacter agri]|uniref:DUF7507 domain-containing protein n=1 Tax=Pedobacter agri TaxID=454586 RepID=UPI0027D91169|nr:gliding motility-associated C-terminal domain-containing protein [Pedobacter agri]
MKKLLPFFCLLVLLLFNVNSFAQNSVSGLITDYNGFWRSSSAAPNAIKPDNRHHLLAFTWNGTTYSTGVNDAILAANGVSFSAQSFQAFPVRDVTFLPNGTSANLVALGKAEAGNNNYPYAVPVTASSILTRGIRGLDIGSAFTNIPSNLPLTFDFGAITSAGQLGDGIPDIIITQIAAAGGSQDEVWFEDGNGNQIGTKIFINMSAVTEIGKWDPFFFGIDNGSRQATYNGERPIRIWAADASQFGITTSNYTQPLILKYKLAGSSDPAFLAFNNKFISIVNANDDVASTNENTPININVIANDEPIPSANASTININSLAITQIPANGAVAVNTVNGVRLVSYTPNPGFTGVDTFKYQVCNSNATPQCDDATVTVNVGSADIQVTKSANTLAPLIGGNVVFTLTAKNNGPNTANNVSVRDVLPAGYTFVSTTPATGGFDAATSNWTVGSMANGATASITITARVNAAGPYANTANITTSTLDPIENNNSSTVTPGPVLSTNLAVNKAVDVSNPTVGSNVVFTVTAQNIGPSNATGVTVNDLLPNGYTFVSAVPATGTTYNAGSGVWNIGSLTSGATAITLTVTAKVNPTGTYVNTATISGAQPDPIPGNNTATATPVPVAQADLAITKTVSPTNPDVNSNVVFTIGLTNNGPSAATAVVINDVLPAGYSYVSSSASAGSYNNADGKWTLGTVNNAATAILSITAKVNATGAYRNTATASTATADPNSGNNTASATPTPVAITDLKITKTAAKDIINNAATVNPGDNETFTIVVTNTGPSAATNVVATDVIPNGYTFSNSSASIGSYNQTTGKWTIGNLANGASATLTINAIINASGNYSNHVTLTGAEKDLDLSNNEAYAPLANTNADVSIVKTVNNVTPNVGANVTFTLVANNAANSTSDATQVTVTDILPSGYTYVSSSATLGTYNVANGVWYIGNLLKGSTQTLTLVAKVNPTGDYLNTTHVVATQSDPVPANNSSQALVMPVANADLSVVKTINSAELNNNRGVFTIVVSNNGPSTATNVIVNDVLPTGYTFTSSSATTGNYAAGVWTVGSLVSGASATLTLNSTLNSSGNYVNTATTSSATNDAISFNNTSSAQPAPLAPTGNASQTFCEIADAKVSNLVASGNSIKWYAAASGGTALAGTVALVNGSKYYATQTIAGAESVNRFEVTVTITATPAPTTTASTQTFCEITGATTSSLQITGTAIKWYTAATGGTLLADTTPLANNTTYYASQTLNGCESKSRRAVTVAITTTAPPTGITSQTFCEISSPTINELVATATGLVKWYETANSTVALASTRPLVNGETYYSTQTLNGCESLSRFAVTVQISVVPPPTATTPQSFCASESAKISNLSASGSNVQWYNSSTGGSPLAITTPLVNGTTYYASQTVNGCESKARTPVNVTINDNPTAAISGGGTVCAGAALPNVSITLTGTAPWNIIYNNGSSNISVTGITASPYVISNASAGTYTVTSVSNASCAGASTGSAQVIVNPLPTVTVSGGGASCIGSPKSSVSFAFTGTAPFTFTYTDGTNAHTVTNTSVNPYVLTNPPVGNYSVSALTDATGCTGTFSGSAQVSENVIPTATISGGGVVCYGVTPSDVVVTLTGTAPFSFNYTVGSVTNSVTNYNSNTFNIVNPAEGTYSITQLHDANCTGAPASTTVSVVVINVPDVVITHPNCVNNNSGSIQVTSPLDPSIEYSIDNGTSWQSNPFFGNLAAGSFTVLARKGTCLSNPRAAVLDPAVNDPIISIVQPDCLNSTGTITVTAHPNQEYSLNGAAWVTTNVFSGLSNGTYTVKVRNTTTLCESNIANANINPQPATPNAPVSASPLNYCVDETASVLSATADGTNTLLWYNTATGGVGSAAAPTPVTNVAGLQEFYVSQRTSAGCESIRTKIEVNINALPAAPITDGDKETCEAVIMPTLTATAPAVPGFNIVWYNAASGGNIVASPTLNTVGTVTYYAAAQNATTDCLSATRTAVVLTINPTSTAPVSGGDQVVCATVPLQTLTATANTAAGNTVVWYDAPTGGNITTPTHHAIGTVTYYAASKNNGTNCESLTRTAVSLTINETPALPVGLDQTECAKTPLQTLTATASVQSGQSVVWYTAANAGNVVTDPSLSTSGTITYYAAAKDNATGCESLTRTPVVLTLRLPLTAGTISGNQEICRVGSGTVQPATLTFSTAPAGGATTYTYVWQSSLDNFATVLGNNLASTANYTPNPINTTTYYRVLITSGDCGTVTSNTVTISVKDAPTLTANASQSLCSTTSITNIVYTWGGSATGAEASNLPNGLIATQDLAAKTLTISGTPNSSGTYTVITTGAIAPCTSQATITGTITVNPLPAAPTNTTANAVQCATLPTQTITATASASGGSTVVWYDASSGGNIITPSLNTIGSVTFYAASKNNTTGCESASRTPVTLTINELPSVPSSGGNQTQCADANLQTLTATAVAPAGITTVWYNAPSGGSVVVNPILNAIGSVTYYAASQDNFTGCLSTSRTPVSLTINPRSTASDLTVSSKSICAGQTTTLNATTSLVSPTFRWYATADLSIAPIHIGDNFTTPVLTSTTIYYVTVQGDGICENLPNTALAVTVTINPLPTATITGTTSVCQNAGDQTITFTGAGGTAPYTFTYNIDGGANQTIVSSGNVATLTRSSSTAGSFIYNLVSVQDASSTNCSNVQTGSATITVNPLPTATITGTTAVCQNAGDQTITFTGSGGTAPYTFTYNIDGSTNQTVVSIGNVATLIRSSATAGSFVYNLVSVQDASSTNCSNVQTGTATVTVNPLPTAAITGTTTVCQNAVDQTITFTGAGGTAPYTFTYNIDGGANQTIVSIGNVATLTRSSATAGNFIYNLVSVQDASSTNCSNVQTGTATITVNPLPTTTITGTTTVCQNAGDQTITFTGAGGTAPYTFIYNIDGGANQTIVSSGNVATLTRSSATAGSFVYNLVSVQDASSTNCSNVQTGTATVTINPTPKGFNDVATLDCSGSLNYNIQSNLNNIANGGNAVASTFIWTVNSNANVIGAANGNGNSISQTLINTSNITQQVIYTIVPTATGAGNCIGNSFTLTVDVPVCSAMTILKSADKTSISKAGDIITYTIEVKNTGNANQTNVTVNDPLINSSVLTSPTGDNGNGILEKGETWVYTGSYNVVQSDIDNDGKPILNSHIIRNTATVSSNQITTVQSANADVNITNSPSITLVKTGVLALDRNTISYSFVVKNTGNVTINSLLVNDPKITSPIILGTTTLAPGAITSAAAIYTILQSEKETGSVSNTASISGITPTNVNVSDVSGTTDANDNPTIVNTGVLAINDTGVANGFTGGEAVANVLANDSYNGNPATLANVNLSMVSTTNPNVSLDPLTGKINVAPNTPAGKYTVEYRIEDKLNPGQFKTASVTVTVEAPAMIAAADTGLANGFTGGEAVANVLANDSYNGNPATLANVNLSMVSTTNPNVALDPLTGKINVAPNTPAGTYTVEYRIEDKLNPGQFKTASVTVTVEAPAMIAAADTALANGFTGGEAVANVLANDSYNGSAATLANVNLSMVSTTNPNVALDPLTGKINVAPNTPAGTYTVEYRIEDKLNPGQFKTASVTVTVEAPAMIAAADTGVANGFTGGEAVANVLANDSYNGNPATLANVNLSMVSTTNPNVALDPLTGKVNVAQNTPAGTYTVEYRIADKLNPGQFKTASVTVTVKAPTMIAAADTGVANGFTGGEAVANVLANDSYNGNPATLANVNLSMVSTTNPNVALDPLTGKVNVAANTAAGTYTVEYRIEDKLNPGQFKTASITVTIEAPTMIAAADTGVANGFTGGEAVANVLANDSYNGNPATLANVNLSMVSTTNPNVALDPLTGKVNVAPNTPAGTYTVEYRIADKLNPGQFKTASVTVTVEAPTMIAAADTGVANGFTGGEALANVLANDSYNGNPATLANINLSMVSTTNPNVALDPLTGKVNVAPNTPAGTYTVEYRIEDKLNPGQFKTASVTITVTTGTITAVADNGNVDGFTGGVAVANILANDTYNGNIAASLSNVMINQLTTSSPNVNIDITTGKVNVTSGTLPGTYTLTYEIVDKLDGAKKSNATIMVVVPEWITDLSVTKTANKTGVELNENISYTITIKNNGPATILAGKAIGLVENIPAALDHAIYTANGGSYNPANQTFTVAADLLAGETVSLIVEGRINSAYAQSNISNTATVNSATGTNDPNVTNNTATVTTPILKGKVTLVKSGMISADGNSITYTFTITNIGEVALNNIVLVDAKLGLNKTIPGTLAVGANVITTEIYNLTQADKDLGSVTNTASVNSKSAAGNDTTDISGTEAANDNPTVVAVNATAGLQLTKVADHAVSKTGDVINYTLNVKNTGTVTLTNVAVTDAKADAGSISPSSISILLPGESAILKAKHTLTQTEVDFGSFSNQASASGKNPQNLTVSDLLSDDPATPVLDDATVTPISAAPSMLFTKTALNVVSKAGDVINYTLIVRNTGNVTLSNLAITDAGADAGSVSPSTIANLLPGAMVTITAKHTLTQAEVNSGRFSNQANVLAHDPKGIKINQVSDDPNTIAANDPTIITIGSTASIVLTKEADNSGVKAGDVINYILIAKNTGNVTLTNVVVVDAGADAGSIQPAVVPLILPGASATITAKHTLTQAEVNSGLFSNQASVNAKDPLSNTVTDPKSDDPTTVQPDDATIVYVTPSANIVTVKQLKNPNQSSYIPGEEVVFLITMTNRGPSAAVNVHVVDNAPLEAAITKWTATATGVTLPATSGTGNLNQTIPLLPDGAVVVYEVTVKTSPTSKLPLSNTVEVTSATPDLIRTDDVLTTNALAPQIRNDLSITKKSNHSLLTGLNDVFEYEIAVKNDGLFTANSVVVTDMLPAGLVYVSHRTSAGTADYQLADNSVIWTTPVLNAGETITLNLSVRSTVYGTITNTATVKAAEIDPIIVNNSATDLKEIVRLTIPNLFTPNGDGRNDVFEIRGLSLYQSNELTIVNRWGNEVFRTKNYQNNWSGEGLNEGTYYYLLRVQKPGSNQFEIHKGFITLIRNFKN